MSAVTIDELCDAMFDLVKSSHGKRDLKPMDVTKAMIDRFGSDRCDKQLCKKAIRQLIDSGRCQYKYAGGSYITLPPST